MTRLFSMLFHGNAELNPSISNDNIKQLSLPDSPVSEPPMSPRHPEREPPPSETAPSRPSNESGQEPGSKKQHAIRISVFREQNPNKSKKKIIIKRKF